jgi:hypothetical protein
LVDKFHVQKWPAIQLLGHQPRHQIGIPLELKLLRHHYDAVLRELPCQFMGLEVVAEIQYPH